MTFSHKQISVKSETDRGYTPCQLDIENGFMSFQKMGAVAGVAGGLVGLIAYENAKRTNEVIRIPLSSIFAVEPESTAFVKRITVRAMGFPAYTFGCSKKEMEAILALLHGCGSNNPEHPGAVPYEMEFPVHPGVGIPNPQIRSATLRVRSGILAGKTFRLREGQTMILGRDPTRCNLTLGGYSTISGRHCCLEMRETGLTVTDLGSSNGTWVNGVRVTPNHPTAVPDGSELCLADRNCTVQVKFD